MAQEVKELAAKSDDLSSNPRTFTVEERLDFPRLSSDLHIGSVTCVCTHTHTRK